MAAMKRVFRVLTPEYADAAVKCVAETFGAQAVQRDPFTRLFDWRQYHWQSLAEGFIHRSARSATPLSIVAFNTNTGMVDGVMCNEDFLQPPPPEYYALGSDFRAVRAIFKTLHTQFHEGKEAPREPGDTLHCVYFTCVRPDARGIGLMKGLWSETINAARNHGFRSIVAEASTETVRQVLNTQLGFQEATAVPYGGEGAFKYDGAPAFAPLVDTDRVEYSRLSLLKRRVPSDLY